MKQYKRYLKFVENSANAIHIVLKNDKPDFMYIIYISDIPFSKGNIYFFKSFVCRYIFRFTFQDFLQLFQSDNWFSY